MRTLSCKNSRHLFCMICCLPAHIDSIKCSMLEQPRMFCVQMSSFPSPRSDANNVNTSPGATSSGTVAIGSVLVERPHSTKTDYNIGLPSSTLSFYHKYCFRFIRLDLFPLTFVLRLFVMGLLNHGSPYFLKPDYLKTRTDGRTGYHFLLGVLTFRHHASYI